MLPHPVKCLSFHRVCSCFICTCSSLLTEQWEQYKTPLTLIFALMTESFLLRGSEFCVGFAQGLSLRFDLAVNLIKSHNVDDPGAEAGCRIGFGCYQLRPEFWVLKVRLMALRQFSWMFSFLKLIKESRKASTLAIMTLAAFQLRSLGTRPPGAERTITAAVTFVTATTGEPKDFSSVRLFWKQEPKKDIHAVSKPSIYIIYKSISDNVHVWWNKTLLRVFRASCAAMSAGSALARSSSQSLCVRITSLAMQATFCSSSSATAFSRATFSVSTPTTWDQFICALVLQLQLHFLCRQFGLQIVHLREWKTAGYWDEVHTSTICV